MNNKRGGYQPLTSVTNPLNPPRGKHSKDDNPHGSCSSCAWHSLDTQSDYDGDVWHRWMCWRVSGSPEKRLETTTDKQPPACECHLRT